MAEKQFVSVSFVVLFCILGIAIEFNNAISITLNEESDHGDRIECFPLDGEIVKQDCTKFGCKWDVYSKHTKCYIDPELSGYEVLNTNETDEGFSVELNRRESPSLYGADSKKVTFKVTYFTDTMLRFSLFDSTSELADLEPPVPLNYPEVDANNKTYEVSFTKTEGSPFEFKIIRDSTGTVLLDSSLGGLTVAEQFLMITFKLPSAFLYGIGENTHTSFLHDMDYKMWPIFARDQPPGDGEMNLYGSHPFYMVSEDDGNSHGVFFYNSHAIDVTTLPMPGLTYRTIGGALDFFVFLGPRPEDVVKQYTQLIGRPAIPPYYALGFQLCKYGYKSTKEIMEVVDRTRTAKIPHDIQYADIDYMDERADFTFGSNFTDLPDYIANSTESLRFILILDHVINTEKDNYGVHKRAMESDVYIKWEDGTKPDGDCNKSPNNCQDLDDIMLGYLWPNGKTATPNFFKNETKEWWKNEIQMFYENAGFSGIWIDMNEPSNFDTNLEKPFNWPIDKPSWNLICPTNKWDDPPYATLSAKRTASKRLSDKTLCMVGKMGPNNQHFHYQLHNLFGWSETVATHSALESVTKKRPLIISRSTFPSSGKFAGHWLGDNTARWQDMHSSIIGLLEFNMFGIPYVGADICGFLENTNEELCQRWMELGAFYPFSRNHNGEGFIDQDPAALSESVQNSSRTALNIRYRLLPYLYTLFYESHTTGSTVVRPLYHEFPMDAEAKKIDRQFLWGPALLISPVLTARQTKLNAYFPNDVWYDFYTSNKSEHVGKYTEIDTPLDKINLHIRGGYILPTQDEALNTKISRTNPFGLIVALDEDNEAHGSMFWDDGESIGTVENEEYNLLKFDFEKNHLRMTVEKAGTTELNNLKLQTVKILGLKEEPIRIEVNGTTYEGNHHYNNVTCELKLENFERDLEYEWDMELIME